MFVDIVEIVVGLVLLVWGADRFVYAASAGARNLGVPPLMIGLTIVAFATSAPEILVSVVAAIGGQPGLAFGNAIGSNIVNIGLVLGCTALLRPIKLRSATLRREMPALLAVSLLTVSLFLDSFLSRIDGLVLLTGLVIVMIWLARLGMRSATNDPLVVDYEAEIPKHVSKQKVAFWFVIGLTILLVGANLLVEGSIDMARILGVSEVVIGITLASTASDVFESSKAVRDAAAAGSPLLADQSDLASFPLWVQPFKFLGIALLIAGVFTVFWGLLRSLRDARGAAMVESIPVLLAQR
ncbi:MAG: hypothetical protein IID59_02220, partial [Proteobacteria bacterium]|nr:hypothetical protein [Pseudomonadota bacterium]